MYRNGKVVSHSGAWRADEKDSRAGLIMPGMILLGARHYQEISPEAMDRAEILADDVTLKTPAGAFDGVDLCGSGENPGRERGEAERRTRPPPPRRPGTNALVANRFGTISP